MPKVVITHAVEDIDRWLQGKAERAAAIESGTGTNVTDYVAQDGSNNIAITADVSDPAALQGMLASPPPEVLAAMQEHGVIQPISAYVEARMRTDAPRRQHEAEARRCTWFERPDPRVCGPTLRSASKAWLQRTPAE